MRGACRTVPGALCIFVFPDGTLAARGTVRASVARIADALPVADGALVSSSGSGGARGARRATRGRLELARITLGAVAQRRSAGPANAAVAVRLFL
jgi:hypothetical protein